MEDSESQDIDYWYIWYNRGQQRKKTSLIKTKGNLLPSAPKAEETEFPFRSTGMYPMRLDYIPNPRAGPGAGANVSPVTVVM